jgi:hypothetical protein
LDGDFRKQFNDKILNFFSADIIRKYDKINEHEMGRTCGTHVMEQKCLQNFVGKHIEKILFLRD